MAACITMCSSPFFSCAQCFPHHQHFTLHWPVPAPPCPAACPSALPLCPPVIAPALNPRSYISHFRSIHRGAYFAELRTTTVRKLLPESWGFLCPVHTPDGSPCGLLNHFTATCRCGGVSEGTQGKGVVIAEAARHVMPSQELGRPLWRQAGHVGASLRAFAPAPFNTQEALGLWRGIRPCARCWPQRARRPCIRA